MSPPIPPFRARRSAGGSGVLLPSEVDGLFSWYDATDITTCWQDTAKTIQVVDGSKIQAIDDLSGNARHIASSGSSTDAHLAFDSSTGVGPNGAACINLLSNFLSDMRTAGNVTWVANGFTIINLMHSRDVGGSFAYLHTRANVNLGVYFANEAFGATGPGYFDGTHDNWGVGATIDRAGVFTVEFGTDNESRIYEGNTQIGTDTTFANFSTSSASKYQLSSTASGPLCRISMWAIWHRILTTTEREGVVSGFLATAGL